MWILERCDCIAGWITEIRKEEKNNITNSDQLNYINGCNTLGSYCSINYMYNPTSCSWLTTFISSRKNIIFPEHTQVKIWNEYKLNFYFFSTQYSLFPSPWFFFPGNQQPNDGKIKIVVGLGGIFSISLVFGILIYLWAKLQVH